MCEGVDYVPHQAAGVSVLESIEQPINYTMTNIVGTVNVMGAVAKHGVKKFTYASSAAVYGDDETMPKREEIVGNRLSTYAVTKFVAEEYAYRYTMHYGLDCYGMRCFNVYGRRQDPNGAYAADISKIKKNLGYAPEYDFEKGITEEKAVSCSVMVWNTVLPFLIVFEGVLFPRENIYNKAWGSVDACVWFDERTLEADLSHFRDVSRPYS